MQKFLPSFLIFLFFSCYFQSQAQTFSQKANLAVGYSVISELLPEGVEYEPFVLLGGYEIWERKKFSIYGEAQLTYLYNRLEEQAEYEGGINFGIAYKIPFGPKSMLRACIGSGPHFITMETRRQANGFIFSDNFELGYIQLIKKVHIGLRARFRHISNAGFKKPNGGIDNLLLLLSVGGNLSY